MTMKLGHFESTVNLAFKKSAQRHLQAPKL